MGDVVFQGFHGASKASAESVVSSENFKPSTGAHHWFGEGRYFFIEGISDPLENACAWAKVSSWCRNKKGLKYTEFGVLSAKIQACEDSVCDLRAEENAIHFEKARKLVVSKLAESEKGIANYLDSMVFDFLANEFEILIFIGNQYIKLSSAERRYRVISRIPNVTMLCARNSENVSITEFNIVAHGEV
jgi:hypothetical protein